MPVDAICCGIEALSQPHVVSLAAASLYRLVPRDLSDSLPWVAASSKPAQTSYVQPRCPQSGQRQFVPCTFP